MDNEIVIIGGGPAGLRAAIQCRESWPGKSVALIDAEDQIGYCRPMLPQLMAGQVEEEKLFLWKPAEDPSIRILAGLKVHSVDREQQTLLLENGERIEYERLILAPGGRPIIPRLEGLVSLRGIFPIRNLPEAKRVHGWITKDHRIVVLGGGLVGVKTAAYLRASDFRVSIVEKEGHLLPQALTARAALFVEDHLRRMGVDLFLGQTLESVEGERGFVRAIRWRGGQIPCDALLIAVGSTPNVSFLEGSGLLEEGKLSVSTALQTRDARIFAAGDAVTILAPDGKKLTPWTWPQAVSQGKLAAENLYRPQPVPLKIMTRPNSMNLQGLSLALLGAPVEGSEGISWAPAADGVFRQAFLRDGRLIGGALLGDTGGAGPLHHLMIQGKESIAEVYRLVKPSIRALPQSLLDRGMRRRRARILHTGDNKNSPQRAQKLRD